MDDRLLGLNMGIHLNYVLDVIGTIDEIEKCLTPESVFSFLFSRLGKFGFQNASIGQLFNPALAKAPIEQFAQTNFPDAWVKKWVENDYMFHDPILQYCLLSNAAYTWEVAYKYASKTGKRILDEGRDFNLINGLAIPVKIPFRPTGVISLSHDNLDLSESEVAAVQLLCIHAYTHILSMLPSNMIAPAFSLTERESEVLHYAAAGKTNWEIGKILGISEQVAKEHMGNISRKMGSANRAHSVTLAIRSGAIFP